MCRSDNWWEIKEYILYEGENGYEILSHIWHKELVTKKEIKVSNGLDEITIAVFIKPGIFLINDRWPECEQ